MSTCGSGARRVAAQTPAPPADQRFWVASATGSGTQTLSWDVRSGEWAAVVMNANAGRGVDVAVAVGAKADWVLPVLIGLLVGGGLLLAISLVMVVVGATGLRHPAPAAAAPGEATAPPLPASGAWSTDPHARVYPLRLDGQLDDGVSRWLWLVKWLLAIPHFIVLVFLWIAFAVVGFIAFFAILFTGRYPRGALRLQRRRPALDVAGRLLLLQRARHRPLPAVHARRRARLPGAALESTTRSGSRAGWCSSSGGCSPSRSTSSSPCSAAAVWWSAGWWSGDHDEAFGLGPGHPGGGLIGILVLIAGVWLLFGGRYPRDLFDFVMGLNRWVFRVIAYATLMRDEYPPFRLDAGGRDPGTPPPATAEPADAGARGGRLAPDRLRKPRRERRALTP